jgi:hypothetical protein
MPVEPKNFEQIDVALWSGVNKDKTTFQQKNQLNSELVVHLEI